MSTYYFLGCDICKIRTGVISRNNDYSGSDGVMKFMHKHYTHSLSYFSEHDERWDVYKEDGECNNLGVSDNELSEKDWVDYMHEAQLLSKKVGNNDLNKSAMKLAIAEEAIKQFEDLYNQCEKRALPIDKNFFKNILNNYKKHMEIIEKESVDDKTK